jgi:hypothetical protein
MTLLRQWVSVRDSFGMIDVLTAPLAGANLRVIAEERLP